MGYCSCLSMGHYQGKASPAVFFVRVFFYGRKEEGCVVEISLSSVFPRQKMGWKAPIIMKEKGGFVLLTYYRKKFFYDEGER